ncbi:MAG: hypothetical protein ABR956_00750 [Terracidiphilus sp.]
MAITLLLSPGLSLASGERFDGKWITTVSCDAFRDALGFSYRFVGEVKDGNFSGLHGTEGEPGYLLVEGKIADDGTARLYATGKTGSKEYVPGRDTQKGTEYGYHIKAQFQELTGTGTRVEGRPCSYEFEKK